MLTENVHFSMIIYLRVGENQWNPKLIPDISMYTTTSIEVLLNSLPAFSQSFGVPIDSDTVFKAFWFGKNTWIEDTQQHIRPEDSSQLLIVVDEKIAEMGIDFIEGHVRQIPEYQNWARRFSSEIMLTQHVLSQKLTPQILANSVSPYLIAISELQYMLDELSERTPSNISITSISQRSPISVSLDGASEAVQLARDTLVPWRRKHAEDMAHLLEQEKQIAIEMAKAEILEKRAQASKERIEAQKIAAEIEKAHEEAKRMKLENERLQLEMYRAKMQLALDVLKQISPDITESEKFTYLVKLMPPIDVIVSSIFEVSTDMHHSRE